MLVRPTLSSSDCRLKVSAVARWQEASAAVKAAFAAASSASNAMTVPLSVAISSALLLFSSCQVKTIMPVPQEV